jgi:hypothetical protein
MMILAEAGGAMSCGRPAPTRHALPLLLRLRLRLRLHARVLG